ncbi:hypothetical protein Tco_0857680 [Tanacetum coccineum]|uniref:Zinc finger, CCHC-type n=1 Tax=Tanacetum coccineum TaxID=301880 RepID=A0ABQ5BAW6_9ASTR
MISRIVGAVVEPTSVAVEADVDSLAIERSELKTLFAQQAEQELLQTTQDFHSCKQEEGQSVSSYVLKMKGYITNLRCLGNPVTLKALLGYSDSYWDPTAAEKERAIPIAAGQGGVRAKGGCRGKGDAENMTEQIAYAVSRPSQDLAWDVEGFPSNHSPSFTLTHHSQPLKVFGLSGIAKVAFYKGIGLWELVWGEQGSVLERWYGLETMGCPV